MHVYKLKVVRLDTVHWKYNRYYQIPDISLFAFLLVIFL